LAMDLCLIRSAGPKEGVAAERIIDVIYRCLK
jgi:hypothetical protein